jgi:hypothetical protein
VRNVRFRPVALATLGAIASLATVSGDSSAATVVLRDGTIVQGEVLALRDGVYTIKTESVGTLQVRKQEVRSIDESAKPAAAPGGAPAAEPPAIPEGALEAAKSRIAEDPQLLALVLALQTDPGVAAAVADPEITKAIAAGDYAALMNNPKIIALLNNDKVRAIVDGLR